MKWFKHDSTARMDSRISKLRMKYGVEGYGLYFYCLEVIANEITSVKYTFELEHDAELLAHELKMDTLKVEEILKWCSSNGLFEYNSDNNRLTCFKMLKRLDDSTAKSPEIRKLIVSAQKLLGNEDSNFIYVLSGNGLYKIGKTKSLNRRLKELKTIFPFDIEMVYTTEVENMSDAEANLHKMFNHKQVKGEWFKLNKTDLDILKKTYPNKTGHSETFRNTSNRIEKKRIDKNRKEKKTTEKNNTKGDKSPDTPDEKEFKVNTQKLVDYVYQKHKQRKTLPLGKTAMDKFINSNRSTAKTILNTHEKNVINDVLSWIDNHEYWYDGFNHLNQFSTVYGQYKQMTNKEYNYAKN